MIGNVLMGIDRGFIVWQRLLFTAMSRLYGGQDYKRTDGRNDNMQFLVWQVHRTFARQ